jgi:hypothetical protein
MALTAHTGSFDSLFVDATASYGYERYNPMTDHYASSAPDSSGMLVAILLSAVSAGLMGVFAGLIAAGALG